MSGKFERTIKHLAHELACVEYGGAHTIFGSAAMALRGILPRDPGDIDVMVSRETWAELMVRGWKVETPAAGDPPLLTLATPIPVHAFYDWNDEHVHMNPATLIEEGIPVVAFGSVFRLAKLETLLRHKEEALKYGVEHEKYDRHVVDSAILRKAIRELDTAMMRRSDV